MTEQEVLLLDRLGGMHTLRQVSSHSWRGCMRGSDRTSEPSAWREKRTRWRGAVGCRQTSKASVGTIALYRFTVQSHTEARAQPRQMRKQEEKKSDAHLLRIGAMQEGEASEESAVSAQRARAVAAGRENERWDRKTHPAWDECECDSHLLHERRGQAGSGTPRPCEHLGHTCEAE